MSGLGTFRFVFWSFWMALSLVLFLGGCTQTPSAYVSAGAGHFSTVVIDAGHGGKDSGGVSGPRAPIFLREKDLTLLTAKLVRDELRRAGLKTVMMREDDHFIELDDRVRFANRQGPGAVLVSIHYDAVSNHSMHGARRRGCCRRSRRRRRGSHRLMTDRRRQASGAPPRRRARPA